MDPASVVDKHSFDFVTGDFDGDGLGDVLVSRYDDAPLTFLSGTRGDSLVAGAENTFANGGSPGVADLDGDGDLDLVVPEYSNSRVRVMLNDGRGHFSDGGAFPTGSPLFVIRCADFDGDGHADLVGIGGDSAFVTVLRGFGKGRFGPPIHCRTIGIPYLLETTDIDGDGLADVLTTTDGCNSISVCHGSRSAVLEAGFGIDVGTWVQSFDVGDIDGDGRADLVAAVGWPEASVRVYLQQPDGRFAPVQDLENDTYYGVYSVAILDLDGDGHNDVCYGGDGEAFGVPLRIAWNRGGRLEPDNATPLFDDTPVLIRSGFIGASRTPQVVALTQDTREGRRCGIALMPRRSNRTVRRETAYPITKPGAAWLAQRGGKAPPDLVMGTDSVRVIHSLGDGRFRDGGAVARGHVIRTIDLDGDGIDEWLVQRGDTLAALDPAPGGRVRERWSIPGFGTLAAIGTFSRSHQLELVGRSSTFRFFPVDRAGDPRTPVSHSEMGSVGYRVFTEGDSDHGGLSTLLEVRVAPHCYPDCSNAPDTLITWGMGHDGRMNPQSVRTFPGGTPTWAYSYVSSFASVDLDGDGRRDLAIHYEWDDWHGDIVVLHQDRDGTYRPIWTSSEDTGVGAISFADFDGDGLMDIATASANYYDDYEYTTGALRVYAQSPDGTFADNDLDTIQNESHWVVVGDWDRDGRPDLGYTTNLGMFVSVMNTTPQSAHGRSPAQPASIQTPAPAAVRFGLDRIAPNPAPHDFSLEFSVLPNEPASVELIDIAGRRVWSREIAAGLGGRSTLTIGSTARLPVGLYFVRLRQGRRTASSRVTIMR